MTVILASAMDQFRFRLRHEQRLNQAHQFKALFDTPDIRLSNKAFLMLVRKNQREDARLAVVVGKRNAKRAVDRHRIKRLFRESFRVHQHQLAGHDVLLLLRRLPPSAPTSVARQQLDFLWDKLLAKLPQD